MASSLGGPRAGGGGEAADAEGGANEEDGELEGAFVHFLLPLQFHLQFLPIEGDNGAQGVDELLGIALARAKYLSIVVQLLDPGGTFLLQKALQEGVALPP